PYVPFALAAGAGAAISLVGIAGTVFSNMLQIPFWVEEEKKADLDGVRALQGNSRGGVYFFETVRQYQLKLKEEALSSVSDRGPQGEWIIRPPTMSIWDPIGSVKNFASFVNHMIKVFSVDQDGNNLYDKIHPPLTERIAYLRNFPQSQTP